MNKLYRILIHTFSVTIITLVAMNAQAGANGAETDVQPAAAPRYNPGVVPPHNKIQGKTYGDWGAEWWKWALSVPIAQSPILDPIGTYGSQNQQGSVWFLAGTFGVPVSDPCAPFGNHCPGPGYREITIPNGTYIFFPLVNTENDYPCPDPTFQPAPGQSMADFLTAGAVVQIDPWADTTTHSLSASVDGQALTHLLNYRGTSRLTTFKADQSQIAIDPCITGKPQKMVSDGYWIMLSPLTPGEHEIKFSAKSPSGPPYPVNLDVTYHVTISEGR